MADTTVTYPEVKFRYTVEIDGIEVAGFSEVSGFDASIDVVEYREGDMAGDTPIKLPGLKKYGNITLKKGTTTDLAFYEWFAAGLTGDVTRTTITITLHNAVGDATCSWQVINAWPTKYTAPDFNATSSEVAIESIEVAHEGMTRVS